MCGEDEVGVPRHAGSNLVDHAIVCCAGPLPRCPERAMNLLEVALVTRMHSHDGHGEEARARLDQGRVAAKVVTIMRENGALLLHQIAFGFQKTIKLGSKRGVAGKWLRTALHGVI